MNESKIAKATEIIPVAKLPADAKSSEVVAPAGKVYVKEKV